MIYLLKGAYCGVVVGVSTTLWLAIGATMYPPNKNAAVVNVSQCQSYINYHAMNSSQLANYTKPVSDIINGTGVYYPAQHYKQPEYVLNF